MDRQSGTLQIGRSIVSVAEVLRALAELKGGDDDADDTEGGEPKIVPINISPRDHARLKDLAARGQTSMAELVRRALAAAGLFSGEG